jgi:hypothetical protein
MLMAHHRARAFLFFRMKKENQKRLILFDTIQPSDHVKKSEKPSTGEKNKNPAALWAKHSGLPGSGFVRRFLGC